MRLSNPKQWTVIEIKTFLLHAYQHCMWGSNSDNTIREPELADLEAAVMLNLFREDL